MWYVVGLLLIFGVDHANAALHSLQYFYTGTTGMAEFPQFVAVGIVDGKQIDYYDSVIGKNVLKQAWMEGTRDEKRITDIRRGHQATFSNSVKIVMERFNQTFGVHTFMRTYGCEWDDETGAINGIYQDGYDGEDFVTMDYKELRYIASVPQAVLSTQKWTNERGNLDQWKNYLGTICVEWLQKYLQYGKSSLQKTVSPQVALLQKSSSPSVACHATGFYPSGVKISWMKNEQEHDEDVDLGELLPNEDGTFQKMSTITVTAEEWKNNKFSCVVEHQGETKIKTNEGDSLPIMPIVGVLVAVVLLIAIAGVGYVVYKKKQGFKPVSGSDDGSSNNSAQPQA